MKTSPEAIASFTNRKSLTDLLRRWPSATGQSAKTLRLAGVPDLLQTWETSAKQAVEAADTLARNAPQVRAMLQTVNERIAGGAWHTTGWNVFDVLGRVRLEDAHSDTLAWLLAPWEAHGLGDNFLHKFVESAWGNELPNGRVYDSVTRKKLGSDAGIIDIEVLGDGWVLAVENKIDAGESPGQTEGYAKHYRRLEKSGVVVRGVFLTPSGSEAEASDVFRPMNYSTLREILYQCEGSGDAMRLVRWFADSIRHHLETQ